ncbi:hypothetical protein [Arvimicrobium flavum]|uniref:hypothetical protein n=1 Tax=Arvimicrobium flavum TaxID=3393320 RepID=UPI00237A299A|nr:hypothetical protein [Mesorhizobium shangrilense]
MKNKLPHLNDHLFAQLERLCDEDLTPAQLDIEARRSKAIVAVADKIIRNAALRVEAARIAAEYSPDQTLSLPVIENKPVIEHKP